MAKILVTGANGQLGNEFFVASKIDVQNSYIFTDVDEMDITKKGDVEDFINLHKPDFIINCAAYTNVDSAENDVDLCMDINCNAVENIAISAKENGIKVIHISTDYVYGGDKNTPYSENDDTSPKSVYGKSKLAGEEVLLNILPQSSIVIRTSWLYSSFGKNFLKTIIKLSKERESLNVINDQIGTPTYAADLATAIIEIINSGVFIPGIYNFSNDGICSWFEYACEICNICNIKCRINAISTDEYPSNATRPAYSVLDKSKIKSVYGLCVPNWKESLNICINLLNKNIF